MSVAWLLPASSASCSASSSRAVARSRLPASRSSSPRLCSAMRRSVLAPAASASSRLSFSKACARSKSPRAWAAIAIRSEGAALADLISERAEEIQGLAGECVGAVEVAEEPMDEGRFEQCVRVEPWFGAVAQKQGGVEHAGELGRIDSHGAQRQPERKVGILPLERPDDRGAQVVRLGRIDSGCRSSTRWGSLAVRVGTRRGGVAAARRRRAVRASRVRARGSSRASRSARCCGGGGSCRRATAAGRAWRRRPARRRRACSRRRRRPAARRASVPRWSSSW